MFIFIYTLHIWGSCGSGVLVGHPMFRGQVLMLKCPLADGRNSNRVQAHSKTMIFQYAQLSLNIKTPGIPIQSSIQQMQWTMDGREALPLTQSFPCQGPDARYHRTLRQMLRLILGFGLDIFLPTLAIWSQQLFRSSLTHYTCKRVNCYICSNKETNIEL